MLSRIKNSSMINSKFRHKITQNTCIKQGLWCIGALSMPTCRWAQLFDPTTLVTQCIFGGSSIISHWIENLHEDSVLWDEMIGKL